MTLGHILAKAQQVDAVQFDKFLTENKIKNTWLDVCITDYNRDYYHITLDDYDCNVLFCDGVYQQ